jgi:hypothetical protein
MIKSEIELDLPFMVPDLVYKFQIIFLQGNSVIEQNLKCRIKQWTEGHVESFIPPTPSCRGA